MTPAVDFDLETFLDTERAAVEAALDRALSGMAETLPGDVAAAVRHGVTTGGKRLRPILCATAYRACGGAAATDAVYDLAVAVELIHAYSLVHDDLPCMDDAELRRGLPTVHRLYGEDMAVRAGAVLIPLAALHALVASRALGCTESVARAVTQVLLEASGAGGMVGGQWLDLMGEGQALEGPDLDRLHRCKTGALLTASLVMGGVAAGAPEGQRLALEAYGAAIGLAFQIADDVLDATASAEVLGKNPSDAALDKSTYVSLYGLDAARARAVELAEQATGALRAARLDVPPLVALARYVVERDH